MTVSNCKTKILNNPPPPYKMKNYFNNTFPPDEKLLVSRIIWKMKNQFPQAGTRFLSQTLLPLNFENFNKALNKRILFPLAGMKNWLKNTFPLEGMKNLLKNVSTWRNEKFVKKYVSTSRNEKFVKKYVSTSRNEKFVKKYVSTWREDYLKNEKSVSTSRNKVSLTNVATPEFRKLQQSSE